MLCIYIQTLNGLLFSIDIVEMTVYFTLYFYKIFLDIKNLWELKFIIYFIILLNKYVNYKFFCMFECNFCRKLYSIRLYWEDKTTERNFLINKRHQYKFIYFHLKMHLLIYKFHIKILVENSVPHNSKF